MKKLLYTFILLIFVSALLISCSTSCSSHLDANGDGKCDSCGENIDTPPCASHTDADNDGSCDVCGEAMQKRIPLIEDGEALFQFVIGMGVDSDVRIAVNDLKLDLKDIGIGVEVVADSKNNERACEVLIGNVSTRGEKYLFDRYSLGKDGFAIFAIDGKIILTGGSTDSILLALEIFAEESLGFIKGETEEITNAVFTENTVYKQENYPITSISIRGNDLLGYNIAVDKRDPTFFAEAEALQNALYSTSGYYLPIVSITEADKSIVIERVSDAGEDGFRITTRQDGSMRIECAYPNKLADAMTEFLAYEIQFKTGALDFSADYLYETVVSRVTYEEFGAVGNGLKDDSEAILKAHAFANEGGQTVVATPGKNYLIKNSTSAIPIRTNVIWTGAEFTIDSRSVSKDDPQNCALFYVASSQSRITLSGEAIKNLFPDGKIDKDNLNFNWPYDFPALVIPYNANHKNYIRSSSKGSGADQMELIYVDENGIVSDETPFLFDYEEITSVLIIRADDKPITLEGGTFHTLSSRVPISSGGIYMTKGIRILRSNVTLRGLKNYVTEPPKDGNMYPAASGFFFTEDAHNVTFIDCVMTGRYKYYDGTYGIQTYRSNQVLYRNCTQSNFYVENEYGEKVPSMDGDVYWGIAGSSYCKNMTYDGCTLSRFDAHAGIYNGKIINSTINAVEIIGGGTMLIENTKFVLSKSHLIDLRTDYGSTWRGDVIIRNCEVVSRFDQLYILRASYLQMNFGYTTYMPSVTVDGLKVDKRPTKIGIINISTKSYGVEYKDEPIYSDKLSDGTVNKNQYQPIPKATVLNNAEGYDYVLSSLFWFDQTVLEGVVREQE